jgi:hypothetical protein
VSFCNFTDFLRQNVQDTSNNFFNKKRKTNSKMKGAPPQSAPQPQKSNARYWLLGIMAFASVLIILQLTGVFKSVDRTQSSGWMDMKSAEYENRKMPERRPERPQPQVEATLSEIASEFEGQIFSDIRTANTEKGWGLTDDEAQYYDRMRQQYKGASTNWLGIVKKSYSTYRSVKEALGGSTDAVSIIKDASQAINFYNRINEMYGISPNESANFAQTPQAQTAGDWAAFIESRRRLN